MRPCACQHCPSTNYPPDPECIDIRAAPKQERLETAFVCAWDDRFYCRGYCLYMDISNDDLRRLQELESEDTTTGLERTDNQQRSPQHSHQNFLKYKKISNERNAI